MVLTNSINDLEQQKFIDQSGLPAVRSAVTSAPASDYTIDSITSVVTSAPAADKDTDSITSYLPEYDAGYATADTQIKASAGFVHSVTIAPTGVITAGVITIYDDPTEGGTVIYTEYVAVGDKAHTIFLDVACANGIYVGYDGTVANVSVSLSYL